MKGLIINGHPTMKTSNANKVSWKRYFQ